MTDRERFIEVLGFGKPDRLMMWQLFGLMPGVLERWQGEGMPAQSQAEAMKLFGFDAQPRQIQAEYGPYPRAERRVIEDNDEFEVFTDNFGRTNKLIKSASTVPLPLDFPVKSAADWEEWEPRFKYHPGRMAEGWLQDNQSARYNGQPVSMFFMGLYHMPRQLMGDLELSLAFYDQPELLRRILDTYTDLIIALGEEALSQAEADIVYLGEDYAYSGGAFISPAMFREFLSPYYRKIIGFFKSKGVKLFAVDSDGKVDELIPLLLEVGVNVFYPFEVQAGNDIAQIRRKYGRQLAMVGGLNKMEISQGKAAIDRELDAKLPTMRETGGYIASLDHRVTVETSYADYVYYVEGAKRRLFGKEVR